MAPSSNNGECPFGPAYQVYWNMRYALFSRFDEARVDPAGLYTMVPEGAALQMARQASGPQVLDICSGIGSMSIAFARSGNRVISVEIDAKRVAMARHNASIYGVADAIDFWTADITSDAVIRKLPEDLDTVFLDPPWGRGPGDYQQQRSITLRQLSLADMDLRELVERIECREVMMRLPRNFETRIFRHVTGDKVALRTRDGLTHWFYVRTSKKEFVGLSD